ncbi:MAG: M1 family aminopeptidase, partial [Bacteroidota bacterium]
NYAGDSTKMNEYFNRLGRWGKWTNNTREDTRIKQYWRYLADARLNIDQSLTLRSEQFTLRNYGDMVYGKTSLGFQYLLSYLGDSIFDAAMHDYFRQWKFKHPRPDDLRTSLEKSTGKDLGWLFEDWLGSTEKLNYAVIGLETGSDSFKVSLKNRGGISGPVAIGKTDASGKKENVWLDGFDKDTIVVIDGKPTSPHLLDEGRWMPERNRKDNSIRESGVFRKTEPLQFRLWTDMEDPERTQLYISPALGWNLYNSVMTGMVIHNIGFPQKNLEFALMPMYAWGTKDLAGGGFLNYKIMPVRGLFKEIRMQTGLQHYALQEDIYEKPGSDFSIQTQLYFTRWENQIVFSLRNNTPRNRVNQEIRLRQMTTWQGIPLSASPDYSPTTVKKDFYEVRFKRSNNHPWHYRNAELNILVNNETVRSTLRYKLKTPYSDPRKGLHWQLFAGYVSTSSKNTYPNDYDFQLSGRRGYDDFMFDHAFLGRDETSGILSKQFVSTDGGFATYAPTRFSESWMITAGLKADIPGKLPVQAFFNIGCFERADRLVTDAVMFPYEAGLQINVLKEALKIYIPVTFSKDIRASLDNAGLLNFGERIRFELDLRALNPLDRINR